MKKFIFIYSRTNDKHTIKKNFAIFQKKLEKEFFLAKKYKFNFIEYFGEKI